MSGARALHHVPVRSPELLVVGCALGRLQRAHVVDGLRRDADCRFVDSFDELEKELDQATRCDALVLGPQDQRGRSAIATIERVVREWPATAIVMFFPHRQEGIPSLHAFAIAGVHQMVFEGVNNTALSIATQVMNARRACAAEVVLGRLQAIVPVELHSLAQAVVSRPEVVTTVEQASAALGVHRKTLVNRATRTGFLPPAEVIAWCRLALVGYLLGRTGATVESIANTLGFASHTALRNLIKRYTGQTATDIRNAGGLDPVVAAAQARIGRYRSGLPIT